jgi:hypothetical protein
MAKNWQQLVQTAPTHPYKREGKLKDRLLARYVPKQAFDGGSPPTYLYAFYDELPGLEPQLIIATSGGGKGKQSSDIRKARDLRQRYLEAKLLPDTHIEIREKTP